MVKGVPVSAFGAVRPGVEVGYVRSEAESVFGMEGVSDCKSEGGAGCVPGVPVFDGATAEVVLSVRRLGVCGAATGCKRRKTSVSDTILGTSIQYFGVRTPPSALGRIGRWRTNWRFV